MSFRSWSRTYKTNNDLIYFSKLYSRENPLGNLIAARSEWSSGLFSELKSRVHRGIFFKMTEKIIYICGEFPNTNRVADINSKCLILGSLASLYSVRTHPIADAIDTSFDKTELYNTITRCHVFVFIFSKDTVNDSFYLNQFGIAKAYGVPVIGVREPSYFMPNPLPEQFYFTEIVDYTGDIRDGRSNRGIHGAKKQFILADALIHDFKTAMVYAPEFHKSCFQRLLHKVSQAFNRSENEKKFYSNLNTEQPKVTPFKDLPNSMQQANVATKPSKCPKCGFSLNKQLLKTPTLQRASSTGSLLRKGDAFEQGEIMQQKQLTHGRKTTLQPTTIVIPAPSPNMVKNHDFKIRSTTQNTLTVRQQYGPQKVLEPFKGKLQTRVSTLQKENIDSKPDNDNIIKNETENSSMKTDNSSMTELDNKNKVLRKQSRVGNGNWTDKLRIKLRRQSSLPVIPTTYLVTSPAGDQQLSFVKYPPDSFLLSPRQSLLPLFSEDEEQETIHISRAPSPDGSNW